MKQGIYAIFDSKAEYYLPPFVARTDAEAQRLIADVVVKPGSMINQHPEDFCLFRIGSFSMATGEIAVETCKSLGKGCDLVSRQEKEEGVANV